VFDDDNDQYGFWREEHTGPLQRLAARRRAADSSVAPAATHRQRIVHPQVGRRQHLDTQQVPVIATAAAGVREATGHVDPLLRRMGALSVAIALCVPVAMALRPDAGRDALSPQPTTLAVGGAAAGAAATEPIPLQSAGTDQVAVTAVATDAAQPVADATAAPATSPATESTVLDTTASNTISSALAGFSAQAIEAAAPTTTELVCVKDYEVAAGDYWILIAQKVSVSLSDVLAANAATVDTPLYAGRTVCLPAAASAPTTAAPATTAAVRATTTTVTAPTTAAKATTTSTAAGAAPTNHYSRAEVEAIIREVWPDELEDEAVRIATRESNLVPTARNYCCFGLFQLYFSVHRAWLGQIGVTAAEQLYDPMLNSYAAYAMYLRAGGWGPWKL
jgi:LysM repeat protein